MKLDPVVWGWWFSMSAHMRVCLTVAAVSFVLAVACLVVRRLVRR